MLRGPIPVAVEIQCRKGFDGMSRLAVSFAGNVQSWIALPCQLTSYTGNAHLRQRTLMVSYVRGGSQRALLANLRVERCG
jgi:hypothetical protein